jgi:hypothetical protein
MERVTYDEAISALKAKDPETAEIIEEGILMMEVSIFKRYLTDDEKMIAYSSYLTGIILGRVESSLENAERGVPSLN